MSQAESGNSSPLQSGREGDVVVKAKVDANDMYSVCVKSLKQAIWNWYLGVAAAADGVSRVPADGMTTGQKEIAESSFRKQMDGLPARRKVSRETTRQILAGLKTYVKKSTLLKYAAFLELEPEQFVLKQNSTVLPSALSSPDELTFADSVGVQEDRIWVLEGSWTVSVKASNAKNGAEWALTKQVLFQTDGRHSVSFCVPEEGTGRDAWWRFEGKLSEAGTVITGVYSFDEPDGKRKHGSVIAVRLGSNEIRGRFIGRNIDFTPYGLIYGELHAVRAEELDRPDAAGLGSQ